VLRDVLATTTKFAKKCCDSAALGVTTLRVFVTFILCFGNERWYRRSIFYSLYVLAFSATLIVLSAKVPPHILVEIGVFCVALFAVCIVCHGELVKRKPAPEFLSTFYLTISMGGALGSFLWC